VPTDASGVAETQVSYWPLIVVACTLEEAVAPRAALFRSGNLKEALLAVLEGIQALFQQSRERTLAKVSPVSCPSSTFAFCCDVRWRPCSC
jgi:hypothetical protein